MAGINEYRRAGAGYYAFNDQSSDNHHHPYPGHHPGQSYAPVGAGIGAGDEYPVPSGRASSRGDYYTNYASSSRAISPYSMGNTSSPRPGGGYSTAYNLIDRDEGKVVNNYWGLIHFKDRNR